MVGITSRKYSAFPKGKGGFSGKFTAKGVAAVVVNKAR